MPDITFEDPPEGREGTPRVSHAIAAAQLRHRPGQWAVVDRKARADRAAQSAYGIRTGRLKAYAPAGFYEAMSRTVTVKDGAGARSTEYRVYARYVGPGS